MIYLERQTFVGPMFVCDRCSFFCFERSFRKGDRRAQVISEMEKPIVAHAVTPDPSPTPGWIAQTPACFIPRYDKTRPHPARKLHLHDNVIPPLPENAPV